MTRSTVALALVVCIVLIVGGSLATGQPWLSVPDPLLGIPLGNLATWAMLIVLALSAWKSLRRRPMLRWPAGLTLAASVLWFPLLAVLAGNVYLAFSGGAASRFRWIFTVSLALAIVSLLIVGGGLALVGRRARRRDDDADRG